MLELRKVDSSLMAKMSLSNNKKKTKLQRFRRVLKQPQKHNKNKQNLKNQYKRNLNKFSRNLNRLIQDSLHQVIV